MGIEMSGVSVAALHQGGIARGGPTYDGAQHVAIRQLIASDEGGAALRATYDRAAPGAVTDPRSSPALAARGAEHAAGAQHVIGQRGSGSEGNTLHAPTRVQPPATPAGQISVGPPKAGGKDVLASPIHPLALSIAPPAHPGAQIAGQPACVPCAPTAAPGSSGQGASLGDRIGTVVQGFIDGIIEHAFIAFDRFIAQLLSPSSPAGSAAQLQSSGAASPAHPEQTVYAVGTGAGAAGTISGGSLVQSSELPGSSLQVKPTAESGGFIFTALDDAGVLPLFAADGTTSRLSEDTHGGAGGSTPANLSRPASQTVPTGSGSAAGSALAHGVVQMISSLDAGALFREISDTIGSGVEWVRENAGMILSTVAGMLPYGRLKGAIGTGIRQLKKLFS